MPNPRTPRRRAPTDPYDTVLTDVVQLVHTARSAASRAVDTILTSTYWAIGRRIVLAEQDGERRAAYGEAVIERLAADLTDRVGNGFSRRNLEQMRKFFLAWPEAGVPVGLDGAKDPIPQTLSALSPNPASLPRFPLPWSHYARLLGVKSSEGREFYEVEALRGGWTVRQLDRQIASRFYERTALSRNKAAMLRDGQGANASDAVTPEEALKQPYVLEFLDLKDEYSESDFEEALVHKLETFLLELGGDFAFVGRQRRLRVGDEWYRIDLLLFHRRLRCLVIVDLKLGRFTHADAGQMHLYLNFARVNWTLEGENPPVGLILCAEQDSAVAHYALDGLPNKVLAAEYRLKLPDEKMLVAEIERVRREFDLHRLTRPPRTRSRVASA